MHDHLTNPCLPTGISPPGPSDTDCALRSAPNDLGPTFNPLQSNEGEFVPIELVQPVSQEKWVAHNGELLQEFANRQAIAHFDDRVKLEVLDPSQFLLGTFKLLANRDKPGAYADEPSRRLPPQLLVSCLDLEAWAKEYLRVLFGQTQTGALVSTLLTVVAANFYDLYIHVMDNIVKKALSNKDVRRGSCLEIADFAFSYELHLTQILPFFVEASHQAHDNHIPDSQRPPVIVSKNHPPLTPLATASTTRSGRKVQPTRAKKQALEQKNNKTRQKARGMVSPQRKRARVERPGDRRRAGEKAPPVEQAPPLATTPTPQPEDHRQKSKLGEPVTSSSPKARPKELPAPAPPVTENFPFTFRPPPNPEARAQSEYITDWPTPEGTLVGDESEATMLGVPKPQAQTPTPASAVTSRRPAPNAQRRLTITVPARKSSRLANRRGGISAPQPNLTSESLTPEQSLSVPSNHVEFSPTCPPLPPAERSGDTGPLTADIDLNVMIAANDPPFEGSPAQNTPCGSSQARPYPSLPPEAMSASNLFRAQVPLTDETSAVSTPSLIANRNTLKT